MMNKSGLAHFQNSSNLSYFASKENREIANLTERKNMHTPRIWCQRICLSKTTQVTIALAAKTIVLGATTITRWYIK